MKNNLLEKAVLWKEGAEMEVGVENIIGYWYPKIEQT